MNRSDFFKRLGLVAGAVVVAPQVVSAIIEEPEESPQTVITIENERPELRGIWSKAEAEAHFQMQQDIDLQLF